MCPAEVTLSATELYDHALLFAKDGKLDPDAPRPLFSSQWPPENRVILQRYCDWLMSGGGSEAVIRTIYLPMAGHILGLNLIPSSQLDPDQDLQKAMDYILGKHLGPHWTHNCYLAMLKFRRFLMNERGLSESKITCYDPAQHTQGLPDWLVDQLSRLQHVLQRNWREARLEQNIRRFWSGHLRTWRFLVEHCHVQQLSDLKRSMIYDYIDMRLKNGYSARGVNNDLRCLHGFFAFLEEQEVFVPQTLKRVPCLKQSEPLPRFLTDEQVRLLKNEFERQVQVAESSKDRRNTLINRAFFYLLWHGALRLSELEELRLDDLDLDNRRLMVRKGKGLNDRRVYLTDTAVQALSVYLAVRGMGPTDHVFLYHNQALCHCFVRDRIKAVGKQVGVHVYPHRLRHTCATQLLNAGCRITSIQKFLGHKRLATTMNYARVHDGTVADDYYTAMGKLEQRLELAPSACQVALMLPVETYHQMLQLIEALKMPDLDSENRIQLVESLLNILNGLQQAAYLTGMVSSYCCRR